MQFTLVSTIFNEALRLPQTIADIEAQTIKPSEIVITDAGSNDGTWELLQQWKNKSQTPIILLQEPRCNVARGRNLAIREASNQIIVSTDFGCRFHPNWLQSITKPFVTNNTVQVVGGAFTVIEDDINTLAAKANYVLTNGYNIDLNSNFIPSSRSIAYKKEVWQRIGGYCEWLTLAADDLVFGMQIKALNIPITLVNEPYVYWGRHHKRKQYAKEAFRYGLGDGEARVNFRSFVSNIAETKLRYFLFLMIIAIATLLLLQCCKTIIALVAIAILPCLLGLRSYIRAYKNWRLLKSEKYNLRVFLTSLLMLEEQRISYIKGYVKGYFFSSKMQKQGAELLHKSMKNKS